MRTDPRAADLGASRARLERACAGNQGWAWVSVDDLLALLRVQEAQATRLAAVEAFLQAVQRHGWDAACEVLGDPFGAVEDDHEPA